MTAWNSGNCVKGLRVFSVERYGVRNSPVNIVAGLK